MKKMSDRELYDLCRKYGTNARMWRRKFEALLPEVARRELFRKRGFYSIYEFAAKLAGMNRETVMEVLRVNKKLEDKPALQAQLREQGWSKLRVVANIATPETQELWADRVKTLPKKALEMYVREMRGQDKFLPGEELLQVDEPPTGEESSKIRLSFEVDKDIDFKLRQLQQKLEKDRKEAVSFSEVLKELLQLVPQVTKQTRKTKPTKITRHIPAQLKRELKAKYQGKCGFPSCNKPHEILHHANRFSTTKSHKSIVPLCKTHHNLAHAGLIQNEHKKPEYWQLKAEKPTLQKPDKLFQKYRQLAFELC